MAERNPIPVFAGALSPEDTSGPRLSDLARAVVMEAAGEIRSEWNDSSGIVGRLLRTHHGLPSRERRLVSETIYTLVRFHRRLESMLDEIVRSRRGPVREPTSQARERLKLLILEAATRGSDATVESDIARELGFAPRPELLYGPDAGLTRHKGTSRAGVRLSFPDWLLERLLAEHGQDQAFALAEALNQRGPVSLLVNGVRVSREDLAATLAKQGIESVSADLSPLGLTLQTRVNVASLDAFQDGLFEVMDEGSQLVAEAVDARPGMRVVDACAGAGGKTLALEQFMQGGGRILAMDVNGKKLEEARKRLRRAGFSNVDTLQMQDSVGDGSLDPALRPGTWDRVLVDAPCSAMGSMRRSPETRWRLSPKDLTTFANRQLGLLATYAPLVAPGGRLIYATCTLLAEENDQVIDRFLEHRPGFARTPLSDVLGPERAHALGDGRCLRLSPHRHGTDGFFACVLTRNA